MTKKKNKTSICPKCNANISKTHYSLKCVGNCGKWYHRKCSGLTTELFTAYEKGTTDEKWICSQCVDSNAPEESNSSDDDTQDSSASQKSGGKKQKHKNPTNKDIINTMNKKFMELETALTFNGSVMEDLQKTLKTVLEENKRMAKEYEKLKIKVNEMEKELQLVKKSVYEKDAAERQKNIIISGLNNKETETNVKKVFGKLDINVTNYKTSVLPTKNENKPIILIQLPSRDDKNKILERRKLIMLTHKNCSIGNTDDRIFINEDLSRPTRAIFKKARELKEVGFKYIWCKHGQVYGRKCENGSLIKINTISQVEELLMQNV